MNVKYVKDLLQFSHGDLMLILEIKKQKYVLHVLNLKMYAKLVYLIFNLVYLLNYEINF